MMKIIWTYNKNGLPLFGTIVEENDDKKVPLFYGKPSGKIVNVIGAKCGPKFIKL